jgi:NAD(P)-dependent dehydrogenase (short-subunit alcohol dehydrogenase family)
VLTIVTGGGRGIGAAVSDQLSAAGHTVVVAYRSDRAAAAAHGHPVRADVSDPDDVDRLFAAAAELGPVTGLVNNAGATMHIGDLADTPVEVIRAVLDANLLGTILCARRAAQVMGPGGAIVNVSSSAATIGSPHEYVHYAAAKAGVDALTVGLAKELAPAGIRVNAVAPGLVRTRIHADAGRPDRASTAAARVPLGRPGEPAEIAPAIAWLLGPEATYVTGAVLRVSGGL